MRPTTRTIYVVQYADDPEHLQTYRPESGEAVRFEPGASVYGRPGPSDHPHASVVDLSEREGVKLIGAPGASVEMITTPGAQLPTRDCVKIRGGKSITIASMKLYGAYGDGINVGPTWREAGNSTDDVPSESIELTDVDCFGNGRNALTVSAVRHFTAKRGRFRGTHHINSPYSGICLEPGKPVHPLVDVRFDDFEAVSNTGAGINVSLWRMTRSSEPVSVQFRNGVVNSVSGHMLGMNFGHQGEDNRECPRGLVIFERINFIGCPAPYNAIRAEIWADIPDDFKVIFRRCLFSGWGGEMPFRVRTRTGRHPFVFEDSAVQIGSRRYDAASFMGSSALESIG